MLLISLAICSLGVLQIYSATHESAWRNAWMKQCVWLGRQFGILPSHPPN